MRIPPRAALAFILLAAQLGITSSGHLNFPIATTGHGTSEVILMSPDRLAAVADSKLVETTYLADGSSQTDSDNVCKVRRLGPNVAMAAGYTRASDFHALDYIRSAYRPDESLHDFAARLAVEIPGKLGPALQAASESGDVTLSKALATGDALEVALLGAPGGTPVTEIIIFTAKPDGSGHLQIHPQIESCPGDCKNGHGSFMLGVHEAIDRAVADNSSLLADPRIDVAAMLAGLEYTSHPDVVGGPLTKIQVDSSGVKIVDPGACSAPDLESGAGQVVNVEAATSPLTKSFRNEISRHLSDATNLSCHERMLRSSDIHHRVRQDMIEADLRIVDGSEYYADIHTNGKRYDRFNEVPGAWVRGELASLLRITLNALQQGRVDVLSRITDNGEEQTGVAFHRDRSGSEWSLFVEGNPYALSFDGTAWFSASSGELRQLRWVSAGNELPGSTRIDKVSWQVDFARINVAGESFVAPSIASYIVNYTPAADREDRTISQFSDYQRFASASQVSFE